MYLLLESAVLNSKNDIDIKRILILSSEGQHFPAIQEFIKGIYPFLLKTGVYESSACRKNLKE